jgi:hypothetical protein
MSIPFFAGICFQTTLTSVLRPSATFNEPRGVMQAGYDVDKREYVQMIAIGKRNRSKGTHIFHAPLMFL